MILENYNGTRIDRLRQHCKTPKWIESKINQILQNSIKFENKNKIFIIIEHKINIIMVRELIEQDRNGQDSRRHK